MQQRQEALFGGPLPPGTATVVGRAALQSREGAANSITLLEAARNPNLQKELGLDETQIKQMQSARSELQLQAMMSAPKYVTRFKTMTDEDHDTIQAELQKEIEVMNKMINDRVDKIVTPEQKAKARTLVFQSIGGVDSPLIDMDSLSTLNLTEAQRAKAEAVLQETEAERLAQAEEGFKLLEKAIEKGGVNMSAEDRQALEEEGKTLQSRVLETGKKVGGRLRAFLTPEQLEQEKKLLASRPDFLPRLMREARSNGGYIPGVGAWRPGQELPEYLQAPLQQPRSRFSRDTATE
jgi:hypothetical protein